MKLRIFAFCLVAVLLPAFPASAVQHVHGYTKKSGAYVAPHYRSNRDHSPLNNWSTRGNINPYTGKKGAKKVRPNGH